MNRKLGTSIVFLDSELKTYQFSKPEKRFFSVDPEAQGLTTIELESLALYERIFLLINCPGGDEVEMRPIMKTLSKARYTGSQVHAYGTATVSSAGAYIWSGASHRYAIADSEFMWHTGALEVNKPRDRRFMRAVFNSADQNFRTKMEEEIKKNRDNRSEIRATGRELNVAGMLTSCFKNSEQMKSHFYKESGLPLDSEESLTYFWDEIACRPSKSLYGGAWGYTLWQNAKKI